MTALMLGLLGCCAVVIGAGIALGRSADTIGERTGLGEVWAGAAMLALATSLPELVTGIAAVRMHAPDLAAGDLFGSSLANMMILGLIALLAGELRTASDEASSSLDLTIWLAVMLNAVGAFFVLFHSDWSLWHIRPESIFLLVLYLAGLRAIYQPRARSSGWCPALRLGLLRRPDGMLLGAGAVFGAGALAIFLIAPSLARSAEAVAAASGLGNTFVGAFMVGLSTALPELVTSATAMRLGARELAVATLYGSSACNMMIFFFLDLASPRVPIFCSLQPVQALCGLLATLLMVMGWWMIKPRQGASERLVLKPSAAWMAVAYGIALWLVHICA